MLAGPSRTLTPERRRRWGGPWMPLAARLRRRARFHVMTTAAKKTPAKKTAAKKTPARKTATKKTATKKTVAKTTSAKTTAGKTTATKTIAGYVAGLSGWQAAAVQQLCELVEKAAPDATGSIKWSQPVFEDHGPFCYVRSFASHVNFGFWRGADLPNAEGRLQSGGKKMAHVKITGLEDIDAPLLTKLVKAAVKLNRTEGDPTKAR